MTCECDCHRGGLDVPCSIAGGCWANHSNERVGCLGQHDDPVEADTGFLCYRCFSRLRRSLVELPAVATWIEVNLAASSQPGRERVSGSSEDPIPLRLDALDLVGPAARNAAHAAAQLLDDQLGDPGIEPALRAWSEQVHWERGVAWPDDHSITGFTGFLAAHLSWITDQPWVDVFLTEILDLHKRAGRVAPWKPETKRLKDEACTACGMRALVTHVADGVTRCEKGLGGCGAQTFISDYMQRARGREAS